MSSSMRLEALHVREALEVLEGFKVRQLRKATVSKVSTFMKTGYYDRSVVLEYPVLGGKFRWKRVLYFQPNAFDEQLQNQVYRAASDLIDRLNNGYAVTIRLNNPNQGILLSPDIKLSGTLLVRPEADLCLSFPIQDASNSVGVDMICLKIEDASWEVDHFDCSALFIDIDWGNHLNIFKSTLEFHGWKVEEL